MQILKKQINGFMLFAVATMACLIEVSSLATSGMGTATVTISSGQPCFSIKSDDETKNALPLNGIAVEENVPR